MEKLNTFRTHPLKLLLLEAKLLLKSSRGDSFGLKVVFSVPPLQSLPLKHWFCKV